MAKKGRNIYKRKDGRWEGRILCSDTKKYKYIYGKSYGEVREKMVAFEADDKLQPGEGTFLFNALLIDWIRGRKAVLKPGSYYCYVSKLNKHILPFFDGIKYNAVNEAKIAEFISIKAQEGLSPKYIADMVTMLKSAVRWGRKTKGYIDRIHYADNVKVKHKEPALLTQAQQRILQKYLLAQDDSTAVGIYLCMYTGLRIGELCALRWSDIDLEKGLLYINSTAQRITTDGKKTAVVLTSPKTQTSARVIPLPDFVSERLKWFKQEDNCFLLSGTDKIIEPRCLSYRFKSILKKAGLPPVKFHSLRHTFATNCLQQNFDIKTLSEILGHSGVNITMRVYVHSSLERKTECMQMLRPVL